MTTPLEIFENSVQEKIDEQKSPSDDIGGDLWITDYEKFKEEMQSAIKIFSRECLRLRSRFKLLPVPVVKDGENTGAKYRAIKDQLSQCWKDKVNNIKNVFEKNKKLWIHFKKRNILLPGQSRTHLKKSSNRQRLNRREKARKRVFDKQALEDEKAEVLKDGWVRGWARNSDEMGGVRAETKESKTSPSHGSPEQAIQQHDNNYATGTLHSSRPPGMPMILHPNRPADWAFRQALGRNSFDDEDQENTPSTNYVRANTQDQYPRHLPGSQPPRPPPPPPHWARQPRPPPRPPLRSFDRGSSFLDGAQRMSLQRTPAEVESMLSRDFDSDGDENVDGGYKRRKTKRKTRKRKRKTRKRKTRKRKRKTHKRKIFSKRRKTKKHRR